MIRLSALQRVERIYNLLEEMHAAVFQQTSSRLHEAERALTLQEQQQQLFLEDARRSLVQGDPQQRWIMESQSRITALHGAQLEQMRSEREKARDHARSSYRTSRIRREQMSSLVRRAREEQEIRAARQAQMESDDRFASRRFWNELREDDLNHS